jgi:ESCRT-II complex subunit VPS36
MSLLVEGVALTPSGRPVLAPEELELRMIEGVDVEFGDKRAGNMRGGLQGREADKYVAGVALVTSHRLIWLDQARAPGTDGLSCSVHLSRVIEAAPVPLKMFGSRTRRLRLALRRGIVGPSDAGGALVLAFRGENPDAFTAAVADALAKKTWLAEPPPPSTRTGAPSSSSLATRVPPGQPPPPTSPPPPPPPAAGRPAAFAISAGVGGVLHRQHQEHKHRQETLGRAFTDMNALMAKAKEMVTLAEHLAAVAARRRRTTNSSDASGSDASDAETTEMDAMMLSMGIASPVTRETAGALYHQQLARQLADWLPQVLAKRGGILALPDVFCLFNRARGSELISPEDLLKACQLWRRLGVPLQFRRFESGVQVVQSLDRSDDEVCATLTEMINRPLGEDDDERGTMRRMDAYAASVALGIPPTIASEYLLMAERHGILCRDDGPEATYFYPNFFPECEAT